MKTSFSRMFFPAAVVLILALGSVGMFFQYLARRAMNQRDINQLTSCAQTVCRLATAYRLESPEDYSGFLINLTVASEASQAQVQICDAEGVLILCADSPAGCHHQGLQLSRDQIDRMEQGMISYTGELKGIYAESRHVVTAPMKDEHGCLLGFVIVSSPTTNVEQALNSANRFFLIITISVSVTAVCMMSFFASRHSKPLRKMSKAAIAFGHGDLEARVQVDPASPVEIRELALAFNNMAASLQKSEYQRQQFVANVSHELKTPMTTIAGFADGILDGTIPAEKQQQYLQLISAETKRLSRLVRSMLEIARLQETGGVPEQQKTRFDLTECAGQALFSFEKTITEKKLDVQVEFPDYPVYTRANRDHIVQVIYNLVDNAVKFCPEDGRLTVKLTTGDEKIYVTVGNSGQSIPAEELPLLFDRFHKLDKSRSQNREGWGLGLYIVKTIICAHGEDISVHSQDGWTEFTFTLPFIN